MSFIPSETELKPLTDYELYITRIRHFGEELKQDIDNHIPPNEAIGRYNEKLDHLRDEFVTVRVADYYAVRKVNQMGKLEVEKDSIGPGEPKATSRNKDEYPAPKNMIYDTHDFNVQSSIGDCHAYDSLRADKRVLTIEVTARARHKPQGKSHIVLIPIVAWKYDPSEVTHYCKADFETLERLADDRYYQNLFYGQEIVVNHMKQRIQVSH